MFLLLAPAIYKFVIENVFSSVQTSQSFFKNILSTAQRMAASGLSARPELHVHVCVDGEHPEELTKRYLWVELGL